MTIEEEIRALEEEIRNTKYNKATSHHIGRMKAKIARLRQDKEKQASKKTKKTGVRKAGDAMAALVGPVGTGKSTLLNLLTGAKASEDPYDPEITPGILSYKGAKIQILDVPDLLVMKGDSVSAVRDSDLVILVNDPGGQEMRPYLDELYASGIRLNQAPPDVLVRRTTQGGINVTSTVDAGIDQDTMVAILQEYRVHNCDVLIRETLTEDRFIDALESNRRYIRALKVLNKSDLGPDPDLLPQDVIAVSGKTKDGIDRLADRIFDELELIRVYMKPQGGRADLDEPMVLHKGASVEDLCDKIHRDFRDRFRYATVSGSSAKHEGQRAGLDHLLNDEDVVTIVIKK